MYKELLFGQEARDKIKKGVNIVADAVSSTLGPRGQNVIFEESSFPTITKDGVTVAQQVFLEDKFENMGNMIAREAAENTNREAGDGTTTTIVLLRQIFNEGFKAISTGMNPVLIKRGMDEALKSVLELLEKQTKKISTDKEKEQVATISANNDKETGKLISDVIKKVGVDGVITVTQSNSLNTEVEYVKGTKINSGYANHLFINDGKSLSCKMENPEIILCSSNITMSSQLVPLIERCVMAGKKNMVLIANEIEGQAMAFLVQNYLQGKFTCVPVRVPSFGGWQKDLLYDVAALIEANVLGDQDVKTIEEADIVDLGNADLVVIGRNETIISGAKGKVSQRIQETKALLEDEKDVFSISKLKERIGRLSGSIANIKVGGASESEQQEIRYRMEDSINATKSAIEEGIVLGGGMALLNCYKEMKSFEGSGYKEELEGARILIEALTSPLKKIVENGGKSGDAIVDKLLDQKDNIGYNALTNKYEDLFKAGVIDPKKVVRNEISNAVATAGILLTSGCAITIKPKKNE